MNIDWVSFTPVSALVGGALIGLAAAVFVLVNGRVAGISGIVGGLLRPEPGDLSWRLAFIAGMLAAPLLWGAFSSLPEILIEANYAMLAAAGLIVGVSTRYGAGCTSGHGVCGVSRLSPRSLAATVAFMATGFLTIFLIRHVIGG